MATVRDRALSILELLVKHVRGLPLSEIGDRLSIPRSATHRLLTDLREAGYVRQNELTTHYSLTVKLAALGLNYLAATGLSDISQPVLDELAAEVGELVRFAVFEEKSLVWIAKAQGAKTGLRYDPDAGVDVYLAATATGIAWLSELSKEKALELVIQQGFDKAPHAPQTLEFLLKQIEETKEKGYAWVIDAYVEGTSSVALVVKNIATNEPTGVLSIAGPSVRFTAEKMEAVLPLLKQAAEALGQISWPR